jgi:ribosomal protein L7Ae-like RNA K-turn-binding protein
VNKLLSLLGLAKRAQKVIVGTDAVISKLQANKLYLIFVAKDSSLATIDKIEKKAFYYNVKVIKSFTSDEISKCIGSNNNKVLGIADKGFADAMLKNHTVEVESE